MESRRFDALTRDLARALAPAGTRRGALATLTGGLLGGLALPWAASPALARKKKKRKKRRKERKEKARGPCAPGKSKKNTCKKGKQCCTGVCKKGRCLCLNEGQSCSEDRNCCPESTGLECVDGSCRACDVCPEGCPHTSIRQAIEEADEGDTIRICAGTYQESDTIVIDTSLTLRGAGQGEDGTVLDGQDQRRVVWVGSAAAPNVFLERLRITRGNVGSTGTGGGGIINEQGALTLTDCTVSDSTAIIGGGIDNSNSGKLTLAGCTVSGNTADAGGGIFNVSGGTTSLIDTTVRGNRATDTTGGGIFNHPSGNGVSLDSASHVCDNEPDQCVGFTPPDGVCTETCPA